MARPRKNQPIAPQRIKEAFWELIADNDLKNITIGMITDKACCNRGTFYYHFDSIDALLRAIIEEEIVCAQGLPRDLLMMFRGGNAAPTDGLLPRRAKRLCLLMERAGQERVGVQVKAVVVGMWEAILCNGSNCLTPETRLVIEYSVSGIIGAIDYLYRQGELSDSDFPIGAANTIRRTSGTLMRHISETQSVPMGEIETRILMFDRFLQMKEANAAKAASA